MQELSNVLRFSPNDTLTQNAARGNQKIPGHTNKTNLWLKSQPSASDWQTALPHMHTSVIPADCRVSCHAATRWLAMRATADWHCSGEVDRVTPGESSVGGANPRETNGHTMYSKWAPLVYLQALKMSFWLTVVITSMQPDTLLKVELSHTHLYTGVWTQTGNKTKDIYWNLVLWFHLLLSWAKKKPTKHVFVSLDFAATHGRRSSAKSV